MEQALPRIVQLKSAGPGIWTDHARKERNRGFYVYAQEFYRAALKAGSPLVKSYLLGHALELLLKTFLLERGTGETALRKTYGHDLSKLLKRCRVESLETTVHISKELERDMEAFGLVYNRKDLEYFTILHLLAPVRLPELSRVMRFTNLLSKRLMARLR